MCNYLKQCHRTCLNICAARAAVVSVVFVSAKERELLCKLLACYWPTSHGDWPRNVQTCRIWNCLLACRSLHAKSFNLKYQNEGCAYQLSHMTCSSQSCIRDKNNSSDMTSCRYIECFHFLLQIVFVHLRCTFVLRRRQCLRLQLCYIQ